MISCVSNFFRLQHLKCLSTSPGACKRRCHQGDSALDRRKAAAVSGVIANSASPAQLGEMGPACQPVYKHKAARSVFQKRLHLCEQGLREH